MPEAKNVNYSLIDTSGNIRNQMISPGESKILIFIKWTDETRILEKRLQNMEIKICYESLLKDYWYIDSNIPNKIETSCIINKDEEFGN